MSIEWDSLILGGNELNTVGPATEYARQCGCSLSSFSAFTLLVELRSL